MAQITIPAIIAASEFKTINMASPHPINMGMASFAIPAGFFTSVSTVCNVFIVLSGFSKSANLHIACKKALVRFLKIIDNRF